MGFLKKLKDTAEAGMKKELILVRKVLRKVPNLEPKV
jgi:hypothetical protein